jgi:hypothetical protein
MVDIEHKEVFVNEISTFILYFLCYKSKIDVEKYIDKSIFKRWKKYF